MPVFLSFQIALFICIIIGIGLVIFSLIQFSIHKKSDSTENSDISYAFESIEKSIIKIDKTVDEFERLSNKSLKEMDDKYQELLFLYTLMDDKKAEVSNLDTPLVYKSPKNNSAQPISSSNKNINSKERAVINNPKLTAIIELEQQGLSISEIAKQLDMGQGEVKLILELGRAR